VGQIQFSRVVEIAELRLLAAARCSGSALTASASCKDAVAADLLELDALQQQRSRRGRSGTSILPSGAWS
jgi:hypothetical protein